MPLEVRNIDVSYISMKLKGIYYLFYFLVMTVVGTGASESMFDFHSLSRVVLTGAQPIVLLTLRTWAVWNRNRRLSIILPILYFLVWGSCFVVLSLYLNSSTCKVFLSLTIWAGLSRGSWRSAIYRVQGVYRDARLEQFSCFCLGYSYCLGHS
jgi:hypothetical protein